MRRRSFLAALAAYPVFVRSKGCDSATKTMPKITSVSVETEFQTYTVLTSEIYEYETPPPPKHTIKASYDDGSVKYFECSECEYSFRYYDEEKVSECNIVGNNMIIQMAYARKTDRTPSITAVFKDIKEVPLGN